MKPVSVSRLPLFDISLVALATTADRRARRDALLVFDAARRLLVVQALTLITAILALFLNMNFFVVFLQIDH